MSNELARENAALRDENDTLRLATAAGHRDLEASCVERARLEKENELLANELHVARSVRHNRDELFTKRLKETIAERDSLQSTVDALRKDKDEAEKEVESYAREAAHCKVMEREARERLAGSRDLCRAYSEERDTLARQVEELRDLLKQTIVSRDEGLKIEDQLRRQVEELKMALGDADTELDAMKYHLDARQVAFFWSSHNSAKRRIAEAIAKLAEPKEVS